jgi:hypothetical protein
VVMLGFGLSPVLGRRSGGFGSGGCGRRGWPSVRGLGIPRRKTWLLRYGWVWGVVLLFLSLRCFCSALCLLLLLLHSHAYFSFLLSFPSNLPCIHPSLLALPSCTRESRPQINDKYTPIIQTSNSSIYLGHFFSFKRRGTLTRASAI